MKLSTSETILLEFIKIFNTNKLRYSSILYVNNCKNKNNYLLLKLTYYVVSNNIETIFHFKPLLNLVPLIKLPNLVLPKSSINYDNSSLALKHLKDFKGKSGVYL